MPFTDLEAQEAVLKNGGKPITVGDICREKYRPMIQRWRKEPRWTTAHNILKEMLNLEDEETAETLAFLVFFCKEVMPYEIKKCEENGDVF